MCTFRQYIAVPVCIINSSYIVRAEHFHASVRDYVLWNLAHFVHVYLTIIVVVVVIRKSRNPNLLLKWLIIALYKDLYGLLFL